MTSNPAIAGSGSSATSRRALLHLFQEYERARVERDAAEARLDRFAETIQVLIAGLPRAEQDEFQRRFEAVRIGGAPAPSNRGGEVYGNVIQLFRKQPHREWTASDIQTALAQEGAATDAKAVHNVLTYLARTGRLERVARGRYIAREFGVEIQMEMDEGDPGSARATEHDL